MNKRLIFIAIISIAVLSGCIVTSFYPFYLKEDIQKDTRFNGTWIDDGMLFKDNQFHLAEKRKNSDHKKPEWTFKMKKDSSGYKVKVANVKGMEEFTNYNVTAFKIGKHQLLDFKIDEVESDYMLAPVHFLPVHSIAKYHFSGDTLIINWFNHDYMKDLFEKSRVRIDHLKRNHHILLTAKTEDLQKFILRYINDPKAFSLQDSFTLKLIRKKDD